ncbi:MAG: hypothetical protein A3A57_02985 [Candidatus Woykebacteria bacterium RIFCSPLOWO2_01_FULL_41_12]|uniref:Phosphoglycerate mutase n=1 Tax=Candidatus Woykebacteria bacterium RIFCSPLOWO2_01_FULL_41_12 TaxID=1802604 RepID=A0A1G1WWC2_9BACT|nr:MAG: hypothetical protein A3A57_02985 [Candidatus Woykebacteria bacterium RIFCSPLOWO2_01_FULL_41_12]
MKTTIHFVRHCANLNPDGIIPGRIPGFHLNLEGKERAKKLGNYLKGRPIKAIYTSPIERTFETADIIAEFLPLAKISHVYELIEVDSSSWQGYKLEEVFTNKNYDLYLNDPDTNTVPENLNKLASRMKEFTMKLCEKHKGEEVVCVSHNDPIIALRLILEGKSLQLLKTFHLSIGSITAFIFNDLGKLSETQYTEIR